MSEAQRFKVLANPLRMRMIELLAEEAMSVKELAARLGEGRTKLYRHIAMLRDAGLIHVVATRRVAGIEERVYETVSRLMLMGTVAPGEAESTVFLLQQTLRSSFEECLEDFRHGIESGLIDLTDQSPTARTMAFIRGSMRIPEAEAERFAAAFQELVKQFDREEPEADGEPRERYAFLGAFYPTAEDAGKGGTK